MWRLGGRCGGNAPPAEGVAPYLVRRGKNRAHEIGAQGETSPTRISTPITGFLTPTGIDSSIVRMFFLRSNGANLFTI